MSRPWYIQGRIQVGGTPFKSLGLDWCPQCRMEVDTDTDAGANGQTFVYRRRCKRCGKVIKWGCVDAPLIMSGHEAPIDALVWVHEPGRDRR